MDEFLEVDEIDFTSNLVVAFAAGAATALVCVLSTVVLFLLFD